MNDTDYKTYKSIMSANPVIDKNYLGNILNLSNSEIIESVKITDVDESNTALIIKATVHISGTGENFIKLFIKTVRQNQAENVYHSKGMQEGKFYQFVKDNGINDTSLPLCFDAFVCEKTGEFVIVLEDILGRYTAPESTKIHDKKTWFCCAESLARFHSAFWDHKAIELLPSKSDKEIEAEQKAQAERLQIFISQFKDDFDIKTKRTLQAAMELNFALIGEESRRVRNKENVTLCNGDSHIYNFLLPNKGGNHPLIVDFQFWGAGIGPGDLAHLTRVNFPDEYKKEIQIPLVQHYHNTLLAQGVTDYSWENCLKDYCAKAATMVLIPFYQWSFFDVKYDQWSGDLQELIRNYEYLKCDKLCKKHK